MAQINYGYLIQNILSSPNKARKSIHFRAIFSAIFGRFRIEFAAIVYFVFDFAPVHLQQQRLSSLPSRMRVALPFIDAVALLCSGLFAGAALYISIAQVCICGEISSRREMVLILHLHLRLVKAQTLLCIPANIIVKQFKLFYPPAAA